MREEGGRKGKGGGRRRELGMEKGKSEIGKRRKREGAGWGKEGGEGALRYTMAASIAVMAHQIRTLNCPK